ncbi:WD40 repeat-like protein [Rhizopogon vinicolor AM-OR11-026]|uniref:WD40 repeat-like protein n=1 Tax=Rhizopogon vinicolor AM-OR11-026 TaxID=1314800 RepID=A0A1B7MY07_9AGAM|nr:WD40 repeat-like protein [Rhizopogon vinicolor AM-OR11-026]
MKKTSARRPLRTIGGHTDAVPDVVHLPGGRHIITCSLDSSLRVWDLESGAQIGDDWRDGGVAVLAMALSPNGKTVVAGSNDGTMRLWDIKTGVVTKLTGHTKSVWSVYWSADGERVASGSNDGTVRVWGVSSGKTCLGPIKTGQKEVYAVVYSHDTSKIASGGFNQDAIKIWDANSGELLSTVKHNTPVWSLAWTSDQKKLISGSGDGFIRIFNTTTWQQTAVLEGHKGGISSISLFQSDRLLTSASWDRTARLWNLDTNLQIGPPLQHKANLNRAAISTDGKLLVTGCDDAIVYVWGIHTILKDTGLEDLLCIPRVNTPTTTLLSSAMKKELEAEESLMDVDNVDEDDHLITRCICGQNEEDADTGKFMVQCEICYVWQHGMCMGYQHEADLQDEYHCEKCKPEHHQELLKRFAEKTRQSSENSHHIVQASRLSRPDSPTHLLRRTTMNSCDVALGESNANDPILQDLSGYITKVEDYPVARGGFGEIWKCLYHTDSGTTKVAVKALLVYATDQLEGTNERKLKRIWRELKTGAKLLHRNILPVYGYTSGFGKFVAMVNPWAEKGNLTAFLELENGALSTVRRFEILRDISAGLQYLHANDVVHGDLTGPNVLIHADGTACLCDFGLSLVLSEVMGNSFSMTSTLRGNCRWMAPELLNVHENEPVTLPSKISDIYSFGGIMLHVLTGQVPYYYLRNEAQVITSIISRVNPYRSRYSPVPDRYWYFIEQCWKTVMQDRPLTEQLIHVTNAELYFLSVIDPHYTVPSTHTATSGTL